MYDTEQLCQQLHTLRDYIRWAVSQFTRAQVYFGHGTDNALDESLRLVLHTVSVPLDCYAQLLDAVLTEQERIDTIKQVQRRVVDRVPVPYLTGEAWFAGSSFYVDERVLIPRSPIAELIECGFSPWLTPQPVNRILDLCTGGGCIGIACAEYFDQAQVDLSDVSSDALQVAQKNIERFALQQRVRTVESDLFDNLTGQTYQLIVSNPPYVDAKDLASMPAEYHHEPSIALGSGVDGLTITRQILSKASQYLSEDGLLVVEVGNSAVALEQAYPQVAFTWPQFERGGHGVFVFSKAELEGYAAFFA